VAVGFGISDPEQTGLVASSWMPWWWGSVVVNQIAKNDRSPELVKRAGRVCEVRWSAGGEGFVKQKRD